MSTDVLGKILALTCALLWSVAVIYFKRASDILQPTALNFIKTVVGAVLLLPVLWLTGQSLFPSGVTANDWLIVSLSGIIGISISDSLFFKCLGLLGAGLTAIVDCLYSPLVMAGSWLFLSNTVSIRQVGGALLVVTAVLVTTLKRDDSSLPTGRVVAGVLFGAGAMLCMAVSIVLMKPILDRAPVLWVTEIRLFAALAGLAVIILASRERRQVIDSLKTGAGLRHALPGSVIGNFLSMTLWILAFKLTDVSSAAILNQMNTIFIVILASLWLKEPFTRRRLIGATLGFLGSLLVML